jgi:hypothetical protein
MEKVPGRIKIILLLASIGHQKSDTAIDLHLRYTFKENVLENLILR